MDSARDPRAGLATATDAVAWAATLGVAGRELADLRLALSEAVTNAVLHAYADGEPGALEVLLTVGEAPAELRAVVRDDGVGMAPRADSPGMGVGMALMATACSALEIRVPRSGRGTEVVLTFHLADREAAAVPAERAAR